MDKKHFNITCISFGHKHGFIEHADFVFDARSLKNPFYVEELREHTGLEKEIQDYVINEGGRQFLSKISEILFFALPRYISDGKECLVIAVGCTGGRHRSVTVCELLGKTLKELGYNVTVCHRDIMK